MKEMICFECAREHGGATPCGCCNLSVENKKKRIKRRKVIGYKIVSVFYLGKEIQFRSFNSNNPKSSDSIRYNIGKRTYKSINSGPLSIFDSRSNAVAFLKDLGMTGFSGKILLLKCTGRESIHKKLWCITGSLEYVPKGTILCDSVNLKIWNSKYVSLQDL